MDPAIAESTRRARDALNSAGIVHGGARGDGPRYELFHAASSICSQKVRAVLAHHDLPYVEHELSIFAGDTYLPEYVRLRMRGCEDHGGALVSRHSGSTSVAAGGCDGAVVPTLVDWRTGEVIVDSKRICLHLDEQAPPESRLRPADLAADIDGELAVVDDLPNYQLLMGRTVGGQEAAATRDGVGATLSRKKVAWCDRHLRDHSDDGALVAAYTAKRAKELSAATDLFSPASMRSAYARAESALVELERKLASRPAHRLHGDRTTMSDLFWGVELLRMKNVGVARFWKNGRLPHVERFAGVVDGIPAIRTAVVDWPGAMF